MTAPYGINTTDLQHNTIIFRADNFTEVLRISKDGITANPDVPVDEAARLVLEALDNVFSERERRIAALEAENKRLKDLLGTANALARLRLERLRQLHGQPANEDHSDHHGPDWTDRESEYLK